MEVMDYGQVVLIAFSFLATLTSGMALYRSSRFSDFKDSVDFLQERNDRLRRDVARSESRCDLLESNFQNLRISHNQLLECFNQVVRENNITKLPCNPEPLKKMKTDLPSSGEVIKFIQNHFIRSELKQLIWVRFDWKIGDFKDSSFNELAQSVVNRSEREGKFYDLLRALREERPNISI